MAHQPRLQPHVGIAHLPFDLGPWRERRDRVDDHDVDRARADQGLHDLQCLLSVVGLRHPELIGVDAQTLGVDRVQGVLGVDECRDSAGALGLRDRVQRERRLAGGFGPEDLHDASFRVAADAQRGVQQDGAGVDRLLIALHAAVTQPHQRSLAELLLDLQAGGVERLAAFRLHGVAGSVAGRMGRAYGVGTVGHVYYSFPWSEPDSKPDLSQTDTYPAASTLLFEWMERRR